MKNVLKSLTALMIAFVFILSVACGGGSGSDTSTTEHVYIAGAVGNSTDGKIPVYWKDGVINYLPLNAGYTQGITFGYAGALKVSNSGKVYIIGFQENNSGDVIYGYWEDAKFTEITNSTTFPSCVIAAIAVDNAEKVWIAFFAGADFDSANWWIWKTDSTLTEFTGCTNVFTSMTDNSGNIYFAGTAGGDCIATTFPWDDNWIPTIWKNGTETTTLLYNSGRPYGWVDDMAIDGSGNLHAIGIHFDVITPFGPAAAPPVYWKTTGGVWENATSLSAENFSSYTFWHGYGLAVNNSGTIYVSGMTSTVFPTQYNIYYKYPEVVPIYWEGNTSNPAELPRLAGYNFYNRPRVNAAVDSSGNFYFAGSMTDTVAHANAEKGLPIYWKNGEGPFQLELGKTNGIDNTFGDAHQVVIR